MTTLPLRIDPAVSDAAAVVAVETVALTAGVAAERQHAFVADSVKAAAEEGAVLAWLAVIDGAACVGLPQHELDAFLAAPGEAKLGARELGWALAERRTGPVTVSGALAIAAAASIGTVATGGLGGVHHGDSSDVSADLLALARSGRTLAAAGIKPFLDMAATCERLESLGVPIYGVGCEYVSGLLANDLGPPLTMRFADAAALSSAVRMHRAISGAVGCLALCRVPDAAALSPDAVRGWVTSALDEAHRSGVKGGAVTPFVMRALARLSEGRTTHANEAALAAAIRFGARIAAANKSARPDYTGDRGGSDR